MIHILLPLFFINFIWLQQGFPIYFICWIATYPVYNAIHRLNNWSQEDKHVISVGLQWKNCDSLMEIKPMTFCTWLDVLPLSYGENCVVSSDTPGCFMLGTLWWTTIPSRGSRNTPSCFMLHKPKLSASTHEFPRSFNPFDLTQTLLHLTLPLFQSKRLVKTQSQERPQSCIGSVWSKLQRYVNPALHISAKSLTLQSHPHILYSMLRYFQYR